MNVLGIDYLNCNSLLILDQSMDLLFRFVFDVHCVEKVVLAHSIMKRAFIAQRTPCTMSFLNTVWPDEEKKLLAPKSLAGCLQI